MSAIQSKERINRYLSIILVYALLFQELIPFSRAMESIDINTSNVTGVFYLSSEDSKENSDNLNTASEYIENYIKSSNELESLDEIELSPSSQAISLAAGGPGQSEITGSTANLGGGLVNTFTGDLNYSIPLMDVEGFPIVLSYDPNIGMEQEASWVGLGWNLSLGSINREMRGIPDDFKGDQIERTSKMLDNTIDGKTKGLTAIGGYGSYVFSGKTGTASEGDTTGSQGLNASISYSWGKYTNNYSGQGKTKNFGLNTSTNLLGFGASGGLGFSIDDQNGIGYSKSFSFSAMPEYYASLGGVQRQKSISTHSRSGIKTTSKSAGWSFGLEVLGRGGMIGASKGSHRTFGVQTYVPRFSNARTGTSKFTSNGINAVAIAGDWNFGAGYTWGSNNDFSKYVQNNAAYPGYGYMHYSAGEENPKSLFDFNRSRSTTVSAETSVLSFSAPTFDIFSCSAPGISSTFRAHRYDVVDYHDPYSSDNTFIDGKTNEEAISGGASGTPPSIVGSIGHTTVDSRGSNQNSTSKGIEELTVQNRFKGIEKLETFDQREYNLQTQGEIAKTDLTLLNAYQGQEPSRLGLELDLTGSPKINVTNDLITGEGFPNVTFNQLPVSNKNLTRQTQSIHYKELSISEIESPSVHYEINCAIKVQLAENSHANVLTPEKLPHHIGGVEVVSENGMRYVYGIPVYSYNQSEVSFSASDLLNETDFANTGMASYSVGDNSVSNSRGRHQLFDKTVTPAFSSSFLLTEMLTSDYIDRTGDGPSPDDQGNYYKLNYANPYGQSNPYKWRAPMCSDDDAANDITYRSRLAHYNKNYHTDPWDDMANYLYGEKDMWYAVAIESKNLIAYFCLGNREDQFSVKSEDGGLDLSKPGRLLKKIMLFAKNDIVNGLADESKALQIIEFDYDYSLCEGYVGNMNSYNGNTSRSGKLTLKQIFVYSGKSGEGKTLPMQFEYSSNNPDFAFNSTDRWGNYKPNDPSTPNNEFPYAEQSSAANDNIQAWKLTAINNTAGARTEINYESDRYGFVQDKRAMRMFQVEAMSSTDILAAMSSQIISSQGDLINQIGLDVNSNPRYNSFRNPDNVNDEFNVVYFQLEQPISGSVSNPTQVIKDAYFRNHKGKIPNELYFNMYAKLGNRAQDKHEFIESTVKLGKLYNGGDFTGVVGSPDANNEYHFGWVIIQEQDIAMHQDKAVGKFLNRFFDFISQILPIKMDVLVSQKVNPLQIMNWQYARLNIPCIAYGDIEYGATTPTDFCDYNLQNDATNFGINLYKKMNADGYGLTFDPAKSRIRLFEPDNIKYGGGSRISSITVHDNWDQYSSEENTSFTQNYIYELDNIQTGVSSYEPQVGNNENPFYTLVANSYERKFLPNEVSYQIDPWADIVFPSSQVGYQKVQSQLFEGNEVGYTIEEFYTLKDVPSITKKTSLSRLLATGNNAIKKKGFITELQGYSQGFYVETSDYHGKPKRSETYGKLGQLISSSEIEYYSFNNDPLHFINRSGQVTTSATPRDIDIYADSWQAVQSSVINEHLNTVSIGFAIMSGIPIPILRFKDNLNETRYSSKVKTITFNKVVHNYAIPKAIHTTYLGSNNSARNEYFDLHTGEVIVSSLIDEYNDKLYSINYPAHWYHDNFRNMSENDGAILTSSEFTGIDNTVEIIGSVHSITLNEGDVLSIFEQSPTGPINEIMAWVLENQSGVFSLIDQDGIAINSVNWSSPDLHIRILRTGTKNILSASMMGVTLKKLIDPVNGNFTFPTEDVLSSSAVKFGENKDVACIPLSANPNGGEEEYPEEQLIPGSIINPFLKGTKGNYRMLSSFAFQQERDETDINTIRQNAKLTNYEPFYALAGNEWYAIDETQHPNNVALGNFNDWRKLGEVNKFDEFGKPLQSIDQINVHSAVQYGMNPDLKLAQKATAVNAEATEIGFDGFEDYRYFINDGLDYVDYGFSLKPLNSADLVSTQKHSGRYSLKVTGQQVFQFNIEKGTSPQTNIDKGEYFVRECNCIQGFAPKAGEEYFFSTWIHENTSSYPFTSTTVRFDFVDVSNNVISSAIFSPEGAVIDGWQKIEGSYEIPSNTAALRVVLIGSEESYFDDFRIHPQLAGMTTIVYDQSTMLPMAQHDGYNYTTFYNYDENYELTKIRVETIEGIKTISEQETGASRNQ